MIGLYVHIPFCRSKCPYCDFNSVAGAEAAIPAYLQALGREMALRTAETGPVDTVYVGGGTPTLLGERLAALLREIMQTFPVTPDAEVTVEANPGTVDAGLLRVLRAAGCNRLSLGAQSFDDGVLRFLGRIHTAADDAAAMAQARQAGFDNISTDLIYAVPGQTLKLWNDTLERVCDLGVEHVSCYALTIEPGTPLAERAAAGEVAPVDDESCLEMMRAAHEMLAQRGLRRYEISNWALPGRECRHNLRYWRSQDYLGLGAGAHSSVGGIRWANLASPGAYGASLAAGHLPVAWAERLSSERRAQEALMLALRTAEGAPLSGLKPLGERDLGPGQRNAIAELVAAGLLEIGGGRLALSEAGIAVSNDVFLRLMS